MVVSDSSMANTTTIEFSASPNPVGSGARALGMGGAFIAVADDATSASWNPGVRRKKVKSPDPEILFGAGQSPRFGTHF